MSEPLHNDRFPRASKCDRNWVVKHQMGPNALWLMEWLCRDPPPQINGSRPSWDAARHFGTGRLAPHSAMRFYRIPSNRSFIFGRIHSIGRLSVASTASGESPAFTRYLAILLLECCAAM